MYEANEIKEYTSKIVRLAVRVNDFNKTQLKIAQGIALKNGYNPETPARMTAAGENGHWYTFTREGINILFNGKSYYKIYAANDTNGNKVAKIFYMDGTIEIIKDPRLPLTVDKFYKSISGLQRSK